MRRGRDERKGMERDGEKRREEEVVRFSINLLLELWQGKM